MKSSEVRWSLQSDVCRYPVTYEVIISGVFNRSVCPLPVVCAPLGSVTRLTVSVRSFYTPSTQLHKPSGTAAKAVFSVWVHDVRAHDAQIHETLRIWLLFSHWDYTVV